MGAPQDGETVVAGGPGMVVEELIMSKTFIDGFTAADMGLVIGVNEGRAGGDIVVVDGGALWKSSNSSSRDKLGATAVGVGRGLLMTVTEATAAVVSSSPKPPRRSNSFIEVAAVFAGAGGADEGTAERGSRELEVGRAEVEADREGRSS